MLVNLQKPKDRPMVLLQTEKNDLARARAAKQRRRSKRLLRLHKRARPPAERPEGVTELPNPERTALPSMRTDSLLCATSSVLSVLCFDVLVYATMVP